jgi:two-component system, cell cycle sensor histidine kinase and response regulator CckA
LSWGWKKNRKDRPVEREVPSFGDWLSHSDVLSSAVHPAKRVSRLLAEIQKRSLSEQAILLNLRQADPKLEVIASAPAGESFLIPMGMLETLAGRAIHEGQPLSMQDFQGDPALAKRLRGYQCQSILFHPFQKQDDNADLLVLINYSSLGHETRIRNLAEFAGPLFTMALHNHRLYMELQQKDLELNDWAEHIEKRIEEGTKKLLERELQYHSLFEGTNDGIVVHDREGRILETNRASCRQFGYERKEFLSLTWSRLAGPGGPTEDLVQFFGRILKNENVLPVETILTRKDGTTFFAELSSRKVRFMGKDAIQSFIRDVTIRINLETGLREEREKYRILVESSLVGVFIIQNGIIRFTNAKFEEILQFSNKTLIGMGYFDLVDPEDRSMVIARETKRENGGEAQEHYEVRYLRKDGTRCWCELHCCRVVVEGKSSILGNVLDISERKQWEMQLLESQKMESIGTLAGGIAHDFNNLLGGILGYASLLLSEMKEDHPYYQDLLAIADTAKKAADLTNRLLAFARGGKYQVSTLRINKIAEDVLGILQHSIDPSVTIESRLKPDLWAVKGDSRQIHQTFMNICLNSVDAMPGGGRLLFSTENAVLDERFAQTQIGMKAGEYVKISVSDTGFGMDERTKSRMFEPFFTTKPTNEGKGLGLSVVYGIVKNHAGTILVESERGKGTTITLLFPRFLESVSIEPASPKSPPIIQRTILLVDDEEIIRHVGDRMLKKKGFEVLLAKNGREAVEVYKREKSDIAVVLMDLVMPEMGGKEAYLQLKKINPDVKVVFTSGYGPQDRPDLLENPNLLFLQKPFHTEVLYQTIQTALKNGSGTSVQSLE